LVAHTALLRAIAKPKGRSVPTNDRSSQALPPAAELEQHTSNVAASQQWSDLNSPPVQV
jgi:hypothetical protein